MSGELDNAHSWGRSSGRNSTDVEYGTATSQPDLDQPHTMPPAPAQNAPEEALTADWDLHGPPPHHDSGQHGASTPEVEGKAAAAALPRILSPGTSLDSILESDEAEEEHRLTSRTLSNTIIEEEQEEGSNEHGQPDQGRDADDDADTVSQASSDEALALAAETEEEDLLARAAAQAEQDELRAQQEQQRAYNPLQRQGSLAPAWPGMKQLASLLPRREPGRGSSSATASTDASSGGPKGAERWRAVAKAAAVGGGMALRPAGSLRAAFTGTPPSTSMGLPPAMSLRCALLNCT